MTETTIGTGGPITIETIIKRWESQDRPLFKGSLISDDGRCCAQGDVLRCSGRRDEYLRDISQYDADHEVAKILGISVSHSILLRQINDSRQGSPQDILASPEKILGPHAGLVLAFGRRLDLFDWTAWDVSWDAAGGAARNAAGAAARNAAGAVAGAVAGAAARNAVWDAVWDAAWDAARDVEWAAAGAAAGACNEIQGHEILASLYFLPLFGLTIDDLKADTDKHGEISQ